MASVAELGLPVPEGVPAVLGLWWLMATVEVRRNRRNRPGVDGRTDGEQVNEVCACFGHSCKETGL